MIYYSLFTLPNLNKIDISKPTSDGNYHRFIIEKNLEYILPDELNDDFLISELRNYKIKMKYADELLDEIKKLKLHYEIKKCLSCGGETKIEFSPIEIREER